MDFDPSTLFGPRWGWLTVWVICFVVSCLLAALLGVAGVHPWSDVTADRVNGYHHEQCETVSKSGFFLQFYNFWSNYAYLAAGLLILWLSDSLIGKAIGVVFIFLAFTSGWFHGTLTETGQTFDIVGVYCALTVLIAYAFIELIPLEQDGPWAWIVFAIAVVIGLFAGIFKPDGLAPISFKIFDSSIFTPLLVGVLGIYMFLVIWRRNFRFQNPVLWPIMGFLIAGGLALIFKFTDGNGLLTSQCIYTPGGPIQGHSLWHLLSAVMFVCFFEYIRSVNGRSRSVWPWRISDDSSS